MKSRTWQVLFSLSLGTALAVLGNLAAHNNVNAQELSELLPKDAIAPTQINSFKDLTANPDGFVPDKLRESESPTGTNRAIIGADQRLPLMSREYPWSTVGKVVMISKSGKEYSCTGTLIGKSLVLTNAHCVYEQDRLFTKMYFLPNLVNGRLRNKSDVAVVTNVLAGTNQPNVESADDWAILSLNKPLGEKYGFLRWRSVPLAVLQRYKNRLSVAGYASDYPDPRVYSDLAAGKGYTAGVHLKCSVLGEKEGMLVHDCDTNPGASGSALISRIDGVYQIVGLHAAGRKDRRGRGIENYAVRIGRIEAELSKSR